VSRPTPTLAAWHTTSWERQTTYLERKDFFLPQLVGSFSLFSLLKCPLFFFELPVSEARRGVGCEEEGARPKCDEWRIELTFFLLYESDLLDYRRGAPRGVPSYAGPRLRL